MRATTLVTGLLAGSVLAGCHHRQPMEEQGPVTTTTTTSTTTNMEPVASSTSSTSTSSTSPMPMSEPRRPASGSEMHNDMRMEGREVHLAIASLERVRHELEHAGHEFGGRKGGALKATDAALHELRLVRGQEARDERAGMESPRERRREERELHVALVTSSAPARTWSTRSMTSAVATRRPSRPSTRPFARSALPPSTRSSFQEAGRDIARLAVHAPARRHA